MSDKKYIVPEAMIAAVVAELTRRDPGHRALWNNTRKILEIALKWQSENPIMPTVEHVKSIALVMDASRDKYQCSIDLAAEWIRRMYLAPEQKLESEPLEERDARIRRESRQRCLDELAALSNGEAIESGVGVDVKPASWLALAREEMQKAKPGPEIDARDCPVCELAWQRGWAIGEHVQGTRQHPTAGLGAADSIDDTATERSALAPEPARVDAFRPATPFIAVRERPALVSDNPSEREKRQGIRENVLVVKAEDYDLLLAAYRDLRK